MNPFHIKFLRNNILCAAGDSLHYYGNDGVPVGNK